MDRRALTLVLLWSSAWAGCATGEESLSPARSDASVAADATAEGGGADAAGDGDPTTDGGTETGACGPSAPCTSPPASVCKDASTLTTYASPGTCEAGSCTYAPIDAPCPSGCEAGKCKTNPCVGVTCATPPANECVDATSLRVYAASGTCDGGTCTYGSSVIPCSFGCAAGACSGDPCLGKTCNTPPANTCASPEYLTVYSASGTCSSGSCSYSSTNVYCSFGCVGGVCNGDPCVGKTCNTPPSNYCADASNLVVYSATGTCSGGTCSYTSTSQFCSFGCEAGKCKGDPCSGVSCTTPPSSYCVGPTTLRSYATTGSCSGGTCSYASTDVTCPCSGGKCLECSVDGDCASGKWCNAGTCAPCSTDLKCGPSCTSCASAGKVCNTAGTACVECTVDSHCGSGKYCNGGTCATCSTTAKCGPSCVACATNQTCTGSACALCASDSACGPTCAPCGGATPKCRSTGSASSCVQCLTNADCTGGQVCDGTTFTCRPPCSTTLTPVFSDAFASPSSTSWTAGAGVAVNTSRWTAWTNEQHGVRINGGRLEITNRRSGSPDHGQGYAYVKTGGTGAHYDALYKSTLKSNAGSSVVWSFNMRRDNPESTNGGFKCSSTSSQNDITVGLAYVLATDSATSLASSNSTCSASTTGRGYAVVLGGNRKVRLVRFTGGLRNGTITDIVTTSDFSAVSNYFSVRVTYDATTDQWRLEARSDGTSSFADPAAGTFSFNGTGTDATYVNEPLDYSGPYFQTGCTGLCSSTYTALFDNVSVGLRCAP